MSNHVDLTGIQSNELRTRLEAVYYHFYVCPHRGRLGCGFRCKVKRRWQLPPYGDKWPDSRKETSR